MKIKVGIGIPPTSCTKFRIFVDTDTILQGVLYPDYEFNSLPPSPVYISSKTHPVFQSNILPIKRRKMFINNNRFIEVLKVNNLLRNGITCTVDSLKKIPDRDSLVSCKITYRNFDNIAYYVPDPVKMGGDFSSWGLFVLVDKQRQNTIYSTSDVWITGDWNWKMNYLTPLPAMGQITFEYIASLSKEITPGDYSCYFQLNNNLHFLPFPIPLDQDAARVWVGGMHTGSSITIK